MESIGYISNGTSEVILPIHSLPLFPSPLTFSLSIYPAFILYSLNIYLVLITTPS